MPRTLWKTAWKGIEPSIKYKRRHDLRKRAQKAMEDLILILEMIKNPEVSENHPEHDYAKIFQKDKLFFKMLDVCNEAYKISYKSKEKLANEENWRFLREAALRAGIFVSEKEMFKPDQRLALAKKLERKGKRTGIDYMEQLNRELWMEQFKPKNRWTVSCPRCSLEQFPTVSIDPCPKCGFEGPVMPDLYTP